MEEPTLYVLDTHVLIWYFIGSNRLQQEIPDLRPCKRDATISMGIGGVQWLCDIS